MTITATLTIHVCLHQVNAGVSAMRGELRALQGQVRQTMDKGTAVQAKQALRLQLEVRHAPS
jgi:hypothetical protein